MRKTWIQVLTFSIGISVVFAPLLLWFRLFQRGQRFALRDRLHKADAIVVLAGTRGKMAFLHGKIRTAVQLYQQGWAPVILCTGKFSMKTTDTATFIPLEELQQAAAAGRIQGKDVVPASIKWDAGLGAGYMAEQARLLGVPEHALLVEDASLHTRENAEYVLALLQAHDMKRIILVTSPFHQLRTYLTFKKVLQPHGIEIINYYANADEWNPATWFFSKEHRALMKSEMERIHLYRAKGDLL